MKLIYPGIFIACDEGGYTVEVPDLPGCVTEGDTLEEAIYMGIDAASGWILSEWEAGRQVPAASNMQDMRTDDPSMFVTALLLDMETYTEKYGKKSVRKNLTIPAWLNTFAENHHINFSKILQNALYDLAVKTK